MVQHLQAQFQFMDTTRNNMAKKDDAIYVGINDEIIEVKGAEKEQVLAEQKLVQDNYAQAKQSEEQRKATRFSALQKLGLTDEEIQAIL